MSEAKGRRDFHESETFRLPNGKKRDSHVIEYCVAVGLSDAFKEIIQRIDIHLPKAQLKAALKAADTEPQTQGGDNEPV